MSLTLLFPVYSSSTKYTSCYFSHAHGLTGTGDIFRHILPAFGPTVAHHIDAYISHLITCTVGHVHSVTANGNFAMSRSCTVTHAHQAIGFAIDTSDFDTKITYNGITLLAAEKQVDILHNYDLVTTETLMHDGTKETDVSTKVGYIIPIRLVFESYDEITTLQQLIGVPYELHFRGLRYYNMHISKFDNITRIVTGNTLEGAVWEADLEFKSARSS